MYMNTWCRQDSQFLQHVSGHKSEATVMSHLHVQHMGVHNVHVHRCMVLSASCMTWLIVLACPCSSAKVRNKYNPSCTWTIHWCTWWCVCVGPYQQWENAWINLQPFGGKHVVYVEDRVIAPEGGRLTYICLCILGSSCTVSMYMYMDNVYATMCLGVWFFLHHVWLGLC